MYSSLSSTIPEPQKLTLKDNPATQHLAPVTLSTPVPLPSTALKGATRPGRSKLACVTAYLEIPETNALTSRAGVGIPTGNHWRPCVCRDLRAALPAAAAQGSPDATCGHAHPTQAPRSYWSARRGGHATPAPGALIGEGARRSQGRRAGLALGPPAPPVAGSGKRAGPGAAGSTARSVHLQCPGDRSGQARPGPPLGIPHHRPDPRLSPGRDPRATHQADGPPSSRLRGSQPPGSVRTPGSGEA